MRNLDNRGKSHLVRYRRKLLTAVFLLVSGHGVYASTVSDSLQFRASIIHETEIAASEPAPLNCSEPLRSSFRIGTNLLYDMAAVANLYLECGFSRHAAINLLATFSPWDICTPELKIRTLILQPEFRWYFADNFKGHHVGVEGYYGWYNVAFSSRIRYQDKDGNTPLWGAGLSYGYVFPLSEHLGVDFSISAGYACLVYDCFYNIENGAKFTTVTRNWWGPTKLGISIFYQF